MSTTEPLNPQDRADKIMADYYGSRWQEDCINVNLWLAIRTAITEAVMRERETCAAIADKYDSSELQRGSDGWKIATDIRARI